MSDRKQQEALLERLQQLGTDAALGEAGQLKKLYHDRQMAGLSADVYDAAKSSGEPPKGWIEQASIRSSLQATRNPRDPKHISWFARCTRMNPGFEQRFICRTRLCLGLATNPFLPSRAPLARL